MTDHPADTRPCHHCEAGAQRRVTDDGHAIHVWDTVMGEESKDCGRCDECNPVDTPRLTDAEIYTMLDRVDKGPRYAGIPAPVLAEPAAFKGLLAELRASRSLLADLRAEGCPIESYVAGDDGDLRSECAYCGAPVIDEPGQEPRAAHRPMEDGKPCLWVRISGA